MNPALTRRVLVQAGAAALGATVARMPASAHTLSPDAELFRLLGQEREARAAWLAAADVLDAAADREMRSRPPRPEALRSGFMDHCHGLGAAPRGKVRLPNGNYRAFWRDEDVEELKLAPLPTRWAIDKADAPPRREPDPDGEARRREVIAAYDAWRADRRLVEDAVGLTAATLADDEVGRVLTAAENAIEACRARTIQGLTAKAAWVAARLESDVTETTFASSFVLEVAAFGQVAS